MSYITNFSIRKFEFYKIHAMSSPYTFLKPCIGLLIHGKGKFAFLGKSVQYANEGDLIYIPKGTVYQSTWTGDPLIEFYSLSFKFENPRSNLYKFKILKNYPQENFEKMLGYFGSNDTFLLSIGIFYLTLNDIFSKLEPVCPSVAFSAVKNAIDYIENNCTENFNVSFLADMCGFCPSRFYTLFKEATGLTPIEYKNSALANHAIGLLTSTHKSIEEISSKLNFSSTAYFRRVIKKATGRLPKEIRASAGTQMLP